MRVFKSEDTGKKAYVSSDFLNQVYEKGYRNFLFFVNSTNIIEKTKDNFRNARSAKYLFTVKFWQRIANIASSVSRRSITRDTKINSRTTLMRR